MRSGDATLRELGRLRRASFEDLRRVPGVGEKKLAEIAPRLLEAIATHAHAKARVAAPE